MSKDLPQDFKCLLLFAALSRRPFTKSELGIKTTGSEIARLGKETNLLTVVKKGRSQELQANEETARWAGENLNTEFKSNSKAVRAVLDFVRAKTAAYLAVNQISFADFVEPTNVRGVTAGAADVVRKAYLQLSGGAYKTRVLLKDLRKQIPFDRASQDEAFFELIRSGEADFYPEDDPLSRDEEDDRAALQIADRHRHVVYLHSGPRT